MKTNFLKTTSKYRADIDGLRALAVLSVVIFHAFPHKLHGGFIGVDIFFVISGFLISTILLENLENNQFSFQDFYAKRIRRIFPALLTVLMSCLIFGWVVLFPAEFEQLGKHIAAGSGFVSNFILWQEAGYFDKDAYYKPLLHLWSLGIEEQFYIIWPLLLWFAFKKRLSTVGIIVIIIIFSFSLNIKTIHKDAIATFYLPQTRFWELICGSLLAWITLFKSQELKKIKHWLHQRLTVIFKNNSFFSTPNCLNDIVALIGFILILSAQFYITKKIAFPGFWALLPSLGTVFLIAAGTQAWINRTLLANRFMVWIGLISFPLYLWHWPILSFIKITGPTPDDLSRLVDDLTRLVGIGVAIMLAWLTYQFIELPIRFGDYKNRKTITLLILMSFTGIVGGIIYIKSGLFFKSSQVSQVVDLITNPLPVVKDFDCGPLIPEFRQRSFDVCKLSKPVLPDVMFIGDSHTLHYQNAVWNQFINHSVLMVVQTSCLPFSSHLLLQGECKKKYETILAFLKSNKSIKKVYLSGYWSYLMAGEFGIKRVNWRQAKSINLKKVASFQENGKRLIEAILASNKEVIFLKDIPDLDFDINSCFNIRPLRLSFRQVKKNCWVDYAGYQKRIAPYEEAINELLRGFPQVKIFDPRPLFCANNKCYARDAKLPYYFNGDHLNRYGAEYVIKDMQQKLS